MQSEFEFDALPRQDLPRRERSAKAGLSVPRRARPAAPRTPFLPGCEPGQPYALFLGLLLPERAAAAAADLATSLSDEHGLWGKLIGRERLHVSLHQVGLSEGQIPLDVVARVARALESFSLPPFDVAFGRVSTFDRADPSRPLVLLCDGGLEALADLHRQLRSRLRQWRFKGLARSFNPHVTLLYDARVVPEQAVPPIAWTVSEVVLICSARGLSRYGVFGRWRLAG